MAAKAALKPTGDYEELTALLWAAARKGNVPAMRILRDEMRGDDEKPSEEADFIDEIARKREAAAG